MKCNRIDFKFSDEGGVWWLAPKDLGGHALSDLIHSISEGVNYSTYDDLPLASLLEQGQVIPIPLYGDGGEMLIRLVLGELNPQEAAEWVAQISWKLDLSGGQLLIGDSCDPDVYDGLDLNNPETCLELEAVSDQSGVWTCYTDVLPGHYLVNIYSYLPSDLSSWESIYRTGLAVSHPDAESLESYFKRTRPHEEAPDWITHVNATMPHSYVSFVIQLTPLPADPVLPVLNEYGYITWKKRKPEQCPFGILRLQHQDRLP